MKQRMLTSLLVSTLIICFFTIPADALELAPKTKIIKQKMGQIGFNTGKITKLKNGNYNVFITGFNQKTPGIKLKTKLFKPFLTEVKLSKGTLFLQKSDLNYFMINTQLLLPAVKVVQILPVIAAKPFYTIKYSALDHGEVVLEPLVLTIRYGENVLNLNNGSDGSIQLPENSELLEGINIVVTMEFKLRNTTNKNFRFDIYLDYGGVLRTIQNVRLLNGGTKTISKVLRLTPTNQMERILFKGPVGVSDDTPIVFFNARLMLRVYPL